jgi:hypothetical protein
MEVSIYLHSLAASWGRSINTQEKCLSTLWRRIGKQRNTSTHSQLRRYMEVSGQLQAPAILPPGKSLRKAKCVFCVVCVCACAHTQTHTHTHIYIYSCTHGSMPLRIFWTIHRRIYFHKARHTSQTQFALRIAQVVWYEALRATATVRPLWSRQILSSVENRTLIPSSTNSLYYLYIYILNAA